MPAARDQLFEHCLTRDHCVQMKRLRIKLARERGDLFFRDFIGFRFESIALLHVFEKPFRHNSWTTCSPSLSSGCNAKFLPLDSSLVPRHLSLLQPGG